SNCAVWHSSQVSRRQPIGHEDLAESLQAADDGAAGGSGKTLLLDSRAPEEFAVSHLPNAINVDYKDPAAALQIVRETSPAG
ncbi:hypothetical protein BOX15_Mlig025673g5, partial [Macrostomum lignano]